MLSLFPYLKRSRYKFVKIVEFAFREGGGGDHEWEIAGNVVQEFSHAVTPFAALLVLLLLHADMLFLMADFAAAVVIADRLLLDAQPVDHPCYI